VFVKTVKLLRLALTFSPTSGCAIGVEILPVPLCKTLVYNPETYNAIFVYAILRFALIEIFCFYVIWSRKTYSCLLEFSLCLSKLTLIIIFAEPRDLLRFLNYRIDYSYSTALREDDPSII
jgi:hypothetical protein